MASRLPLFLAELKRRKVYRVAAVYVVVGSGIIGVADAALPSPVWERIQIPIVALVLVGFPIALVLAWAYEIRPETTGHSLRSDGLDVPADDRSVVVLPFENLSPDSNDAYLADGVSEEITADLSGLRALRVISRTSAQHYRGSGKEIRRIGRELSVRYVLEGSVRKAGSDLKITCQLVDAANDAHVWAKKYSGTMADIFDLQERVARSVVDALAIRLDAREERSLTERPVEDLRAYELYLRARQGILSFDRERMEGAESQLQQALEIEGENSALIFQLAHLHYQFWNAGIRLDEEDLRLAREYADRALALDPQSPDYLVIRGLLEVTGGSAVRGFAYLEAALDRNPWHAEALFWSPAISVFFGHEVGANARLAELRRIDPLNPFPSILPIWFEVKAGRFASALELAVRARESLLGEPLLEAAYAIALAVNGRQGEAAGLIRAFFGPREDLLSKALNALACAFEHDREGVLRLIDLDFERWAEKDFQYSEWTAEALAQVNESQRALEWLENSVERGNINYPNLSEHDPFLASLRGTQRFERIAEQARVGWEEFRRTWA